MPILELNKQPAQLHSMVAKDSDTNKHEHVSKLLAWCHPSVKKIWQFNLSQQRNYYFFIIIFSQNINCGLHSCWLSRERQFWQVR